MPREMVVLLDGSGERIGVADKAEVHTTDTALHLAFSCHVLDERGRVLVTRRALGKRTWPGVWTNSFCGHPGPDEPMLDAVLRRGQQELGLEVTDLAPLDPDFRYRAVDASGIVEHEICPVFVARTTGDPLPDPDEVMDLQWLTPAELGRAVAGAPFAMSPWLVSSWPRIAAGLGA